ncbi:hypothetical protein MMC18_004215 [Xylographa bjoerkii]|nr:hypothetical protein [Xylographa bjoerkii]
MFLFFKIPDAIKPAEATLKEKILQRDISGFLTITAGVTCYLLALRWGGNLKTWDSLDVIGTLVGFGVLFIAFFVIERCIAGNFYILLYYLPIYFQAVRGTDATGSGIRSLPLILCLTLTQILTGIAVGELQLFNPFLIVGGILTTIATGLMITLQADSSSSAWIGYQALAGIGLGLCFNVYIIITQNIVQADNVSTATATLLWMLPPSSPLSCPMIASQLPSNTIPPLQSSNPSAAPTSSAPRSPSSKNEFITTLPLTSPSLNPASVFEIGASQVQTSFSAAKLPATDSAYMKGLRSAFAFAVPLAGTATVVAATQKWFRLSGAVKEQEAEGQGKSD